MLNLNACQSLSVKQPLSAAEQQARAQRWQQAKPKLNKLQSFKFNAALALYTPKQNWSMSCIWQQLSASRYLIHFLAPLNAGSAQLSGSPAEVILKTSKGEEFRAANAEQLLKQRMGWRLPVSSLYYWLRGVPVPKQAEQHELNANGQLATLKQAGWQIEYFAYRPYGQLLLPYKLRLQDDERHFSIKIVISQWDF